MCGDGDGGGKRHGDVQQLSQFRDYFCAFGRIDDGDDNSGGDCILRVDHFGGAWSDWNCAADVRIVFAADNLHGDTEHDYAEWRDDGSGVRDTDVLPGDYDGGGI